MNPGLACICTSSSTNGRSGVPDSERLSQNTPDPLAEVWDSVLVPMLQKAPQLESQTLLRHLELVFPDQEWYRRKRTLQRSVEQWKALHGPALGVMFMQHHQPGVLDISNFTVLKGEPITIAGLAFEHRLFHFRPGAKPEALFKPIRGREQPAVVWINEAPDAVTANDVLTCIGKA